jgi:subtilisin family serine protease
MFQGDTHGMYVLSAITGFLPGKLIGAAPEADFYLLRSENDNSEMPVEEDAWVAAAEWADSAGVDVISSSLGYSTFDDDSLSHTYIDMDGHTTHISKAASLLASKGIILVSSAGNSGNKPWHYVTAPADAENILTVGAVDRNRELVGFSSRGPTYDGRVKPDVMSMGYATVVANVADNETDLVSGTSLATPIISGLVTCLWQEFPQKTSFQVMDAIRRSSSLYSMPNDSFGYGIPDFSFAEKLLSMDNIPSSDVVTEVYPNPFIDYFTLDFYSSQEQQIEVTFMDAMGRVISVNTISAGANSLTKINMGHERLAHGIYFAIIKSNNGTTVKKVIRG